MTTQRDIADCLGLDISSVSKILRRVRSASFNKDTIRRVFETAESLGYDRNRIKFGHRRRTPRRAVHLEVLLTIRDGSGFGVTTGTGILKDLSLDGGILRGMMLIRQALPLEPHQIRIRPADPSLGDVELEGRGVRFVHEGEELGVAVEFTSSTREIKAWIRKIS